MIETNIRIVYPGKALYIYAREALVEGTHITPDLLERACGRLRHERKIAAIRHPEVKTSLLVATSRDIPEMNIPGDGWLLDIKDAGKKTERISLESSGGINILPQLIERALMVSLAKNEDYWAFPGYPRIWYKDTPILEREGISAYRSYQIAAIFIDGEGIGIAINPQTAFFSKDTLSYFFDPNVSTGEQKERRQLFDTLTNRKGNQKGTLIYDIGNSKSVCYFDDYRDGVTSSTTGIIRIGDKSYDSLWKYYKQTRPNLIIDKDEPVVYVSFRNLGKPVPVAAKLIRIRVMNDVLSKKLSSVDKINPLERKNEIINFWGDFGDKPIGKVAPGLINGFWKPKGKHLFQVDFPSLAFGQESILYPPKNKTENNYKKNYLQRLNYLDKNGCYYVPPDIPRTIYFAYPNSIEEGIAVRLATDLTQVIRDWTNWSGSSISAAKPIPYNSISEAIEELRDLNQSGIVTFILDKNPNSYYEVAFQLDRWRVKRITDRELLRHYKFLKNGFRDRNGNINKSRGESRWLDFIKLNVLGILQTLDVIPYRTIGASSYEAQLIIDVGYDQRQFALSFLISRDTQKKPDFKILTHVHPKPDIHKETINSKVLEDNIISLINEALRRVQDDPLSSLLVLRDGRFSGQEQRGVNNAVQSLKEKNKIEQSAFVDIADLRKDSFKAVRFWENINEQIRNPLEGTSIILNDMIFVAATGASTLNQGTAHPFMITGNVNLENAANASFIAAQLNWSNPKVAQRLPLYAKRTDEELKTRADQTIKRYK